MFCDDLFCLHWAHAIAKASCKFVVGTVSMETAMADRTRIIDEFSASQNPVVLFISRTGDEALDIPTASGAIVFRNNWASRRQIVQRIGRP